MSTTVPFGVQPPSRFGRYALRPLLRAVRPYLVATAALVLSSIAWPRCETPQGGTLLAQAPPYRSRATRTPPFDPIVVIPRAMPAITQFPVLAASDPRVNLDGAELVLGVVVDASPRAYPINMLTGPRREILNDSLGNRAIAATW